MVSSVNEWGADQTRILLITDQALHRVKYNFAKEEVRQFPQFLLWLCSVSFLMWGSSVQDVEGHALLVLGAFCEVGEPHRPDKTMRLACAPLDAVVCWLYCACHICGNLIALLSR